MDLPTELRKSPWPFVARPEPPVEGGQSVQLMHYQMSLVDGMYKLHNYQGKLLMEWDDWDELLEMLNVWPPNEFSIALRKKHGEKTGL